MSATESRPGLDGEPLERWLTSNLPGARAPFEFTAIAAGHSNLSYRMVDALGMPFVLRRPPPGTQWLRTHDMAREFRIQRALRGTAIPVPAVEALCEDSRVIGAPFYIMRWVGGTVIDAPGTAAACLPTTAKRHVAAQELIENLVAIHQLDVDSAGLDNLGSRDDFVARYTERMRCLWEKVRTRDVPLIDALHARLVRCKPPQRHTGLIHNDYHIGNLIVSAEGHVNAVLDWEFAAIGDVLIDVGALVNRWDGPSEPPTEIWRRPAPTRAGGFPDREALVAHYAQLAGVDVSDLDFYRALAYWRSAIIGEGMKRRTESGDLASRSGDGEAMARSVQARAQMADHFLPA